ncbi:hypothetical protein PTSG_10834 [Salpingoeca rosetta]|uniref:C2 domain-containing protein n=1 Tax=Salpingoeca rosetta (strain ATCC 50818 / BSB-021) TaxID=946362 RepID=F2URI2_SALR5|nr:uncharacterized protein PTSG_10834 [Salpingoeca rosetta]EGD80151.1 hypothetical protein PTSG_10834 [Salpingoeca rosetta]|eukprot:XP_004988213.1 hypothetical protein PTSG_10834 [Salpingoeca rosetta]
MDMDKHIYSYALGREATGVMRVIANKGGIGVRFSVGNYKIAVISTHLNAHAGEERKLLRHNDTREILKGLMSLSDFGCDALGAFHHVFWIGDLNYRLNLEQVQSLESVPESHDDRFKLVTSWIESREWDKINEADELRPDRSAGRVLTGFQEGAMLFPPTYKVERASELQYRDQRIPAYCDRILWRSMPGLDTAVTQTSLEPLLTVPTSDHKPLRATFSIRVKHMIERPPTLGRRLVLVFDELAGHALADQDVTGKSDVYITFQSADGILKYNGSNAKSTRVQHSTLDPTWAAKEIPTLALRPHEQQLELIRACHITMVVRDWDRASRHDYMGSAQVPLTDVDVGAATPFEAEVTRFGVRQGTLTGAFRLALA